MTRRRRTAGLQSGELAGVHAAICRAIGREQRMLALGPGPPDLEVELCSGHARSQAVGELRCGGFGRSEVTGCAVTEPESTFALRLLEPGPIECGARRAPAIVL